MFVLCLALPILVDGLLPQDPATSEPHDVPLLHRVWGGALSGIEEGGNGRTRGYLQLESVCGGDWMRMDYRQAGPDGDIGYSMVQMFRQNGSQVDAWQFHATGDINLWTGTIDEQGMRLESQANGKTIARAQYRWDQGGFQFTLEWAENSTNPEQLQIFLEAEYQPVNRVPKNSHTTAQLKAVQKIPYSWYLGSFQGEEVSLYGSTTGTVHTKLGPGLWFHSDYKTFVGEGVVFSGQGLIWAEESGDYTIHWFEQGGITQTFTGTIQEDGTAVVEHRNSQGILMERHTDTRESKDQYHFHIEQFDVEEQTWKPFMSGNYVRKTD